MRKSQNILFILSIILFGFTLFTFIILPLKPVSIYTIAFISSSIMYLFITRQILKLKLPVRYFYALIGLSIIIKLAFIPLHPIGSDDYYRYVWDGKVQSNGINPYKYAPADTALKSLHSDILPKLINFPDMKTIYPPLSELIFRLSYLMYGESYIGVKIFLFFFDLISIWGILLILRKLNLPYQNVLIYSLCALPIFQYFIDAHLDGLGLPLFLFTIYFYLNKQKLFSLVFLAASICIKPLGMILIPIFFFNESGFKNKLKVVIIPAVLCLLMYLPYLFTGSPFQALMQFTEHWTFNGIIFSVLDMFFKNNQHTRLICGIIFIILYLPVILSRKDLITKIFLSIFLLFICSPVVHPWYLGWLAVLLPFIPRWSGITYVSLISLTSFTILNYLLNGIWKEYTPVLILEYIPVLILFAFELLSLRKKQYRYSRIK
ncbi:MAG: hypothetical protein P4L45_06025 [Ignavibacteriaceae bacterium]|nr:hypothetical protein [Ignavibacteriaceae bacterium]